MIFCNPAVIKNMKDVKLGAVEVAGDQISYLDLIDNVRDRLVDLITKDVDTIVKHGKKSREEAVSDLSKRAHLMLEFFEQTEPEDEEGLADAILKSKPFDLWQMRVWSSFKDIHKGKIEKDSPIASQGVLSFDESTVNDALDELTLEGVLEVLKNYEE